MLQYRYMNTRTRLISLKYVCLQQNLHLGLQMALCLMSLINIFHSNTELPSPFRGW